MWTSINFQIWRERVQECSCPAPWNGAQSDEIDEVDSQIAACELARGGGPSRFKSDYYEMWSWFSRIKFEMKTSSRASGL